MNGGITMAGNVDKTQYEKYEKLAVFIMPYVRPELIKTYNNFIKDRQPERFIYENYIRETIPAEENSSYPKSPITLQDMIAVSTYIALSQQPVEEALGTYREFRRVYKRNLFKYVAEEIKTPDKMSPRNPKYLRKFAELKVAIAGIERSDEANTSIEAIMQDKYLEIDKWRSDTSAPITDFAFLGDRPVKQIANCFIYDLTFESITIIINNFSGSIEGFNVKFPTDLTNLPIIGYRSSDIQFEALFANELVFMDSYNFAPDSDSDDMEGKIEVTLNFKDLPANINKENYQQMLAKYNIDMSRHERDLDMKDREIMTQLFNLINGDTIANDIIEVNIKNFTKKIYNVRVPKAKHYEDLDNRLHKLRNFDYKITVRNKNTGELVESSSIGLLSYLHIGYETGYFQFIPSKQWVDTYVQKKYINILTDSYHSIESHQTKGIMMILQRERIAEYSKGNSSKQFNMKYWRAHMKLGKMPPSTLVKELTKHFTVLKEKAIVIKDFKFVSKNSVVNIEFLPLDHKELMAYDFQSKALEDKSIIEVECKEVTE